MSLGSLQSARMRLTGLSSGLDTDSIVRDLMQLERNKVAKVYRNKTTAEWKLEAYNKLNEDLSSFSNKYMSVLSKDNIMSANAYKSYKANYASNDAFKVTATSSVVPGNYQVTSTKLASFAVAQGSEQNGSITTSSTVEELVNANGGQLDANGKLTFKINGKEFSFDKTAKVSDVIGKVNSEANGAKMYFSEITQSFNVSSTAMGSAASVTIEGAEALGFAGAVTANGEDAKITINGREITKSSNSFTIDGLKFELTGNYQATDAGYSITTAQDTDSVVEKVKAFIDDYNKLVEDLYNKTREKKYHDFYPLTEDEIEAMDNEDDVKKWNDKAKSGLLRSDSVVMGLMSELRKAAYSIVGDTGYMAADIGITTSGKEGKLQLNEEKFKQALAENPDRVTEVMTGRSTATDKTTEYQESGFVARINITMNNYRSSLRANQIQQETQRIYEFQNKILDIEAKLISKEEALWAQYSALETLMTDMNSQSNWLASQLGSL